MLKIIKLDKEFIEEKVKESGNKRLWLEVLYGEYMNPVLEEFGIESISPKNVHWTQKTALYFIEKDKRSDDIYEKQAISFLYLNKGPSVLAVKGRRKIKDFELILDIDPSIIETLKKELKEEE